MKKIIICLSLILAVSCSTRRHLQTSPNRVYVSDSARDGSSYEKAILINEKTDAAGTKAEYSWLKEHYPGYRMIKQTLAYHDKKPFDILDFKTQDGAEKNIYFDISNSFGKGFGF